MRPSILWNVLRGRVAPISKEVASSRMAKARSSWLWLSFESSWELFPGTIFVGWETACFWRSWPWAPDALGGWGGGFCAIKLHFWLGQNEPVIGVVENADSHLSQRGKRRVHALHKSVGGQRQSKGKDHVLMSHSGSDSSMEERSLAWKTWRTAIEWSAEATCPVEA